LLFDPTLKKKKPKVIFEDQVDTKEEKLKPMKMKKKDEEYDTSIFADMKKKKKKKERIDEDEARGAEDDNIFVPEDKQ
ncbi:7142_t:CDS:2, partial [Gigaspora rosea]